MQDKLERRLSAIVAADIIGYSRLIGLDEHGTISALRRLRSQLLEPVLEEFGGRMVKAMGDGFLLEFVSAVEAVSASHTLQNRLGVLFADVSEDNAIRLRIGVHVGDVVIDGEDILGDGVNIAARIEPLSPPGGIAISDEAYRHVHGRDELTWKDSGTFDLKNIARPVRVWLWNSRSETTIPSGSVAPKVPDRPSVAVLPFDNMSGDPEQEHFADGMTEDLITDLSKISGLLVVARNSTFAYKGQVVDIPAVARQLGVKHVVEGSVRKAGSRVRINVQLIEAANKGHVWAERYDGTLDSVFELQDEVCARVVEALSVKLTKREEDLVGQVHTRNVEAYELYVQAKAMPYPPVPEKIAAARVMFERVIEMAPEFAGGYSGLSWMISYGAIWSAMDLAPLGMKAEAMARKAIEVDPDFGWGHMALALSFLVQRRFDEAEEAAAATLKLIPNDADSHAYTGLIHGFVDRRLEALASIDRAARLSPSFVNGPYLNLRSLTRFLIGDYAGAIAAHEENVGRGGPLGPPAYCWAAASYHALGDRQTSARLNNELRARFPDFSLSKLNYFRLFPTDAERQRVIKLMIDAGLPA